jgi:aminoglycoside N3'-acetyltransferase
MLHYSEHMANLPDKRTTRYVIPLLQDGERIWVAVEEYDTASPIVEWEGEDYFPIIARAFLEEGHGRTGTVGAATCHLFDAAELHAFAVAWMERTLAR